MCNYDNEKKAITSPHKKPDLRKQSFLILHTIKKCSDRNGAQNFFLFHGNTRLETKITITVTINLGSHEAILHLHYIKPLKIGRIEQDKVEVINSKQDILIHQHYKPGIITQVQHHT